MIVVAFPRAIVVPLSVMLELPSCPVAVNLATLLAVPVPVRPVPGPVIVMVELAPATESPGPAPLFATAMVTPP